MWTLLRWACTDSAVLFHVLGDCRTYFDHDQLGDSEDYSRLRSNPCYVPKSAARVGGMSTPRSYEQSSHHIGVARMIIEVGRNDAQQRYRVYIYVTQRRCLQNNDVSNRK